MSRCGHLQLDYKLRKLPHCKRCKTEMVLVAAMYDNLPDVQYEWECPRCGKVVPKKLLKEEPLREEDIELSERFGNNNEQKRSLFSRRDR